MNNIFRYSKKPKFITFTGLDNRIDLKEIEDLSKQYPIEWGVLFSRSHKGMIQDIPSLEKINEIVSNSNSNFYIAAHLCGAYTEEIMNNNFDNTPENLLSSFSRIQFNHNNPNPKMILDYLKRYEFPILTGIAQFKTKFVPEPNNKEECHIEWLYDNSGGNGIEIKELPVLSHMDRIGIAGGISSENIEKIILDINEQISSKDYFTYWLDMETSIRTDNWLDINKCRKICEIVYDSRKEIID